VILTGSVADFGEAVRAHAKGTPAQQYNQLNLSFTRGSFRLSIRSLEASFVRGVPLLPARYPQLLGNYHREGGRPDRGRLGSATYRGIRGVFHVTVTIAEVDALPCATAGSGALLSEDNFLTGSGSVFPLDQMAAVG